MSESSAGPPTAPTFRELLLVNVRVVGIALLLAAAAWGLWRLLRLLFPDVDWLSGQ